MASFQGKTIGPHPQLVQEFLTLVGKDFYMYPPDRFLERASEYLKQDASEQAVNEIRDIREEDIESELSNAASTFAFSFGRSFKNKFNKDAGWYSGKRDKILTAGMNIRSRLDQMYGERKALVELQGRLISEGVGPDEAVFAGVASKIEMLNLMVASLEEELSAIRMQMTEIFANQKALSLNDDGSES